jgi:protein arginine kinase activator
MKCEECDEPATVHSSVIIGGTKQEVHLCRQCAEKRKLISAAQKPNLPVIVKQLVGNVGFLTSDLARLQCPDCGTKYMDFRKSGRLGCPYDYIVFRDGLRPLLDRVHRATHHRGKRPRNLRAPIESRGEVRSLRHQLKLAIQAEDYEQAARLRDCIRVKEDEHGA